MRALEYNNALNRKDILGYYGVAGLKALRISLTADEREQWYALQTVAVNRTEGYHSRKFSQCKNNGNEILGRKAVFTNK
jgi:hypothetical protein